MIDARNYGSPKYPFTARQWQELEQQALVFRYLVSGLPVPPHLISTLTNTTSSPLSSSSRFFPLQTPLPYGWGSFQVGYGRRSTDPEPGRCRRTDGKKWRCSKEAFLDSKYCEKHMHRGKSKAKKSVEQSNNSTNASTIPLIASMAPIANTMRPCFQSPTFSSPVSSSESHQTASFYPFFSPLSSSSTQSSDSNDVSTQNHSVPLRIMDPELYYGSASNNYRL